MDVSTKQIISVATSLIPFVEHDDAQRALMGANMQKQAVPLIMPEAPFVGTGMEARAALDSGDVLIAEGNGVVKAVSGDRIVVEYDKEALDRYGKAFGRKTYNLNKFRRSNQDTSINQKPLVFGGETVREGDLLGRRHLDEQRRVGARQEPARRLHALGGLQLRGRDHLERATGARRRVDLDPREGVRDRRARHEARRRGDHPGHPEPARRHPGGPRRPRHRAHRRRSRARRHPGGQGHPEGRDRAEPRRAVAARDLRREGARGARHVT